MESIGVRIIVYFKLIDSLPNLRVYASLPKKKFTKELTPFFYIDLFNNKNLRVNSKA